MNRHILLIDDRDDNILCMKNALYGEVEGVGLDKNDISSAKICCDNTLTQDELDQLINTVRNLINGADKLLIAIDLNLVRDQFNTAEELRKNMMTGIKLKRYIVKKLSDKEKDKVIFLFVSNYLRRTTPIRQQFVEMIECANDKWAVKPVQVREEGKDYAFSKEEGSLGDRKKCKLNDKKVNAKIQEDYYDKETTFGDFIGTIFEAALS